MADEPQSPDQPIDAAAPGKGTVLLQDEDTKLEHETEHSTDVTVDTDIKKTTGSQKRLWGLVVLAVALIAAGGYGFYSQLETGTATFSNTSNPAQVVSSSSEDEVDETTKGIFLYTAGSKLTSIRIAEGEQATEVDISANGFETNSPAVQLSSNGETIATASNQGITIKRGDSDPTTFLSSSEMGGVDSWVLIPDGTKVFALVGSNLHQYDVNTQEDTEIKTAFSPTGESKSILSYSRDGSIRQYAKSGVLIRGSIYSLGDKAVETVEQEVTRLPRVGNFQLNSVSPDGNSIVFIAELNGAQTLQLLSLNSYVIRTVYIAETPGTQPSDFAWSQDSNNIIISTTGATNELVNLKVGTLQKETLLSGNKVHADPQWSPDKSIVSFTQDNKVELVTVESKEVSEGLVLSGVTGWYQR